MIKPPYLLTPKSLHSWNPIERGCVLYLPLWSPALSGPVFKSAESYGHTCTVTGALWRPDGRKFDGVDDRIAIGATGDAELAGLTDTTILAWACPTSLATEHRSIISKSNIAGEDRYNLLILTDGKPYFCFQNNATSVDAYGSTGTVTVDNWYFFSARFGSGGVKIETNLGDQGINANTGVLRAEDGTAKALYLAKDFNNDYEFSGLIGEVWVYSRYLSFPEIQRNYMATKWRYQ